MRAEVVSDPGLSVSPFLAGGGEMGEITRSFNWSATSLGDPKYWPQSLLTTVGIILNSKFPMFLWWGEDLIQFYNDAYRPSLGENGKHPLALGQKGKDCWAEIWPDIYPLIKQVLSGGNSTWSEDQLIPIYRNGSLEDVYWTFSYSPVYDENGSVGGVLVVCNETTSKIVSLKALKDKEQLALNIFSQAPVAVAIFKGPSFIIEMANEKVLEYWGRRLDEVINKPLFDALPEAAGQGYEEILIKVLTTGEAFFAKELSVNLHRKGKLEKTFVNFVYEPYHDLDGKITGVIVVANEITEEVTSRKRAEESEERSRLSIEAAELGTYEIDLLNNEIITSPRFDDIFDVPHLNDHQQYINAIHPGDLEIRAKAFRLALETGFLEFEARVVWKNGAVRWIRVMGNVYIDQAQKPVRLLGVVQDITERKQKEHEIRTASDRLRLALDALSLSVPMKTSCNLLMLPATILKSL